MIVKQYEFDGYLENLVQEARRLNPVEGKFEKAGFQGGCDGAVEMR
jgi:hypothetical protein